MLVFRERLSGFNFVIFGLLFILLQSIYSVLRFYLRLELLLKIAKATVLLHVVIRESREDREKQDVEAEKGQVEDAVLEKVHIQKAVINRPFVVKHTPKIEAALEVLQRVSG